MEQKRMTAQDAEHSSLKRTPLYEQHRLLGARLVEFGGWEMPVQYSSILAEHHAVRTQAGLFDVSHMGEFIVQGRDVLAFLQHLVPNDVARLRQYQALYTQLCQPDGGVVDDLLIYRRADEQYMLVVNAGNIAKDLAWVQAQSQSFEVQISDQSSAIALLALQGPLASAILQPLTSVDLSALAYYHSAPGTVSGSECLISRTGYTGEDGFELYCAEADAVKLWTTLLDAGQEQGLMPAGLGARDTLRLEAAYCLYGHELTETINPLEAGLGWTVKLSKGEFIGREALLQSKAAGLQRKLIGIELSERGVARGGYAIYLDERQVGSLTSGAPAPTLNKQIALGYIESALATPGRIVQIDIRGRRVAAKIVALPFYKRQH
jgi:aminomethyltransferase